jgi:hypothetical protein
MSPRSRVTTRRCAGAIDGECSHRSGVKIGEWREDIDVHVLLQRPAQVQAFSSHADHGDAGLLPELHETHPAADHGRVATEETRPGAVGEDAQILSTLGDVTGGEEAAFRGGRAEQVEYIARHRRVTDLRRKPLRRQDSPVPRPMRGQVVEHALVLLPLEEHPCGNAPAWKRDIGGDDGGPDGHDAIRVSDGQVAPEDGGGHRQNRRAHRRCEGDGRDEHDASERPSKPESCAVPHAPSPGPCLCGRERQSGTRGSDRPAPSDDKCDRPPRRCRSAASSDGHQSLCRRKRTVTGALRRGRVRSWDRTSRNRTPSSPAVLSRSSSIGWRLADSSRESGSRLIGVPSSPA